MKINKFTINKCKIGRYVVEDIFATINVTTGYLWWKKTQDLKISSTLGNTVWVFAATNRFTPGQVVENHVSALHLEAQLSFYNYCKQQMEKLNVNT